ncbi:hypothetical protein Zm00014a_011029 [Zea mays]|uniref:Uncharacterized protein n=1 Tax=Zea mays TaxID=4577 RepID=A0A3L6EWS9_MAIZE|nr:hypothetical protein Zm00014a_011029 [Zea mays]
MQRKEEHPLYLGNPAGGDRGENYLNLEERSLHRLLLEAA